LAVLVANFVEFARILLFATKKAQVLLLGLFIKK